MSETKPNWNWRDSVTEEGNVHRLYDGDEPITLGDPCFDTPAQEELLCQAVNSHADMLAALEGIVSMWNEGSIGAPSYAENLAADVFLHARAVIAKAKGGAK